MARSKNEPGLPILLQGAASDVDRRTFLRATGGALVTAVLACSDGPSSNGGGGGTPNGDLVFASDWGTATGNSANALSDGGKWDDVSNGTTRVEIVPATGLGFPAGMTNVLAGRYRNTDTAFWIVGITNGWALPPVGGVMCKRLYFRHTVVGSSTITYHPVEPAVGNCADEGEWVVNSASNFIFRLQTHSHRWETTLQRGNTYRVEERWERTGTQTWVLHMRVYDAAGTLIRQDSDFNCSLGHGAHSLATTGATAVNTTSNADCLRSQNINWQGSAQDGRGSDDENNNRIYYGGYALSMSDWCGPYTPSEIP